MEVKYVTLCKIHSSKYPEESISHNIGKALRELLVATTNDFLKTKVAVTDVEVDVKRFINDTNDYRLHKLEREVTHLHERLDQLFLNRSKEAVERVVEEATQNVQKKKGIRKIKDGYSWYCGRCGVNKHTKTRPIVDENGKPNCVSCRHLLNKASAMNHSSVIEKASEVLAEKNYNK